MSNILSYKGNANQLLHQSEWPSSIKTKAAHPDKDTELGEGSSISGGRAHLCSHYGSQGVRYKLVYFKIQLYHSWTYTQSLLHLTPRALAQLCTVLLYSEYPEIENNLDIPQ